MTICQYVSVEKIPALTEELGTLGSVLRAPFDAMVNHNYARLAEHGFEDVRPAHGAVFRNISENGSRITDLAARARMTKQSMAELVRYLEKLGYLELRPDPTDGRGRLVVLSDRGRSVFNELVEASRDYERECERKLGARKWRQLKSLLEDFGRTVAF